MFPIRVRAYQDAEEFLQRGLDYCGERGLDMWRLYLLASRARLELDLGRWARAADSATLVLEDPRSAPVAQTWALVVRGLLRARRGDPHATTPLRQARAIAQPTGELDRIAQVAAAEAETAWLSGEQSAVGGITADALELALDRREPWSLGELAYWRWQAGLRDELPEPVVRTPFGMSIAGDWEAAAQRWGEIGCPYEAALARASSDQEETLRDAHEQLRALGAASAAAIVARSLRARGVRGLRRGPRKRTRENPAGLTAREVEVVALLAEGLRNANIAERLIVSEKTVDHHVSSILRKLDVKTRGEAGAAAVRLGILEQS
jgi:DNA-binding CsgD family transcriptional regulator